MTSTVVNILFNMQNKENSITVTKTQKQKHKRFLSFVILLFTNDNHRYYNTYSTDFQIYVGNHEPKIDLPKLNQFDLLNIIENVQCCMYLFR